MNIEVYTFKTRATGIPKMDIIGKADPYLVLRTPMYVAADSRIKDKSDRRQRMFNATTTSASVVTGISVTTAAVFASSLAMALAPVIAGAAVVYAIKYASKLHPQKEGFHEIFVSERKKNTFTPDWVPFQLALSDPFKDSDILFECWDWDRAKPSDYVGSVTVAVRDLLTSTSERAYQLLDHKCRPAGILYISCYRSDPTPHHQPVYDAEEAAHYVPPTNVYANGNFAPPPSMPLNQGRVDAYGACGYGAAPGYGNAGNSGYGNGYDGSRSIDNSGTYDPNSQYGASPGFDAQGQSASGYGNGCGNGYDSLSGSSQSLSSSGYGNGYGTGYDSSRNLASPATYDPNSQYSASPGFGAQDQSAGYGNYDTSSQYGASNGCGNGYDSSQNAGYGNSGQSPNLWGNTGYDTVSSPAFAGPFTGCRDGGYADTNAPIYGGYAAQ
jgi:hypothetical protein